MDKSPDFAPPSHIDDKTARQFFDRGARARIGENRMFLIALISVIANVGSIVLVYSLFPLKQIETIQVHKIPGGRLVADSEPVGFWTPDKDSIAYFLNKWAYNVFDINQSTIDGTIKEAQKLTIGNASKQLTELRRKTNPYTSLNEHPGYTRTYEFTTINFIKDDVALLRFQTVARYGDKVERKAYAMTITFVQIKPTNRAQVMENPAGLHISNFNLTDEAFPQ